MLKLLNKTLSTKNQFRLRFYLARTEGFVHRLRFVNLKAPSMGWPILFGTSFPKSGTNLLAQILTGFSTVAPFAPHVSVNMGLGEIDPKQRGDLLEKQFASLRPLDIIMAHLPARQEMMDRIVSPLFLPYFIFRDPCDIVVSLVFYVTEIEKNDRLHAYYSETLKSMDERLMTTIAGVRVPGVVISSIGKQIEAYMGWLDHPDVHSIRYEDLVRDQRPTLGAMADHFSSGSILCPILAKKSWRNWKHPSIRRSLPPSARARRASGKNISRMNIDKFSNRSRATC